MVIQSTYMNILDINSIEYSLRLLDICCKYSYLRNRNCKSIKLYEYNKTLQGGGRGEHHLPHEGELADDAKALGDQRHCVVISCKQCD